MCDYSIQNAKSRPALVGDKLTIHNFGAGTRGFKSVDDECNYSEATAICVLPGTELAFDAPPSYATHATYFLDKQTTTNVARFRQINKENAHTHHDACEFGEGEFVMLTNLKEGERATVLQLPATPKTEAEAKEQERLPVAA